jgi:hypothetical protein
MSCTHIHTVTTPERPFTSAAGERRAAQGNVSWTEICVDCGASRQVDRNACTDHSRWERPRWQWVGRPNSGDPGWQIAYTPQLRVAVLAVRCRRGTASPSPTPLRDGTLVSLDTVPRGALRYISVRPLSEMA